MSVCGSFRRSSTTPSDGRPGLGWAAFAGAFRWTTSRADADCRQRPGKKQASNWITVYVAVELRLELEVSIPSSTRLTACNLDPGRDLLPEQPLHLTTV